MSEMLDCYGQPMTLVGTEAINPHNPDWYCDHYLTLMGSHVYVNTKPVRPKSPLKEVQDRREDRENPVLNEPTDIWDL